MDVSTGGAKPDLPFHQNLLAYAGNEKFLLLIYVSQIKLEIFVE